MATAEEDSSSAQSLPDSDSNYFLAKCVLKGSAVLHAVHGHLRSSSSFDVVFGKETSIELVVIGEDGVVQSICEQAVFGTIKDLVIVRWNGKFCAPIPQTLGRDLLVVLSESGKLSFLTFCNEMHRFFPVAHVQLSNPGNQRHQLGRKLAVDSNGCFVAVSAYEDRLALFSVSISAHSNIVDKKIVNPPEIDGDASSAVDIQRTSISGVIWSMCFISKDSNQLNQDVYNPMVAIVLNSTKGRLLVLCLQHTQNSVKNSWNFRSKTSSSPQLTSPFREIAGYATEQLSSSSLCSSPDDNSCEGVKLEESEAWQWLVAFQATLPGMVLSVCPYIGRYFLVSAGNIFYVYGFLNENPQRVRKLALGKTRFAITCLTTDSDRIAVGDCRDGILFYSYQEDLRKLEQLYCDPMQRLVADCTLFCMDTAVVSDRKGSIAFLSRTNHLEDNASPECNLTLSGSYYIGEIAMTVQRLVLYNFPQDDVWKGYDSTSADWNSSQLPIVASTLLGSIMFFIPISRENVCQGVNLGRNPQGGSIHELLESVQARLVVHPLTAPILGNDHSEFRGRESLANAPKMLDGDMLAQFLELTSMQQEAVLASSCGLMGVGSSSLKPPSQSPIPVNKVVQLLEQFHCALN